MIIAVQKKAEAKEAEVNHHIHPEEDGQDLIHSHDQDHVHDLAAKVLIQEEDPEADQEVFHRHIILCKSNYFILFI